MKFNFIRCGYTNDFTHGRKADRFPQGELATGKFPWIHKELPMHRSQGKFCGLIRMLSCSTEHEKVTNTNEITCCLRKVFVLAQNPTSSRTQKTQQDFERCCKCSYV